MAQAAVKTKENSSSIISDLLNKTQSNGSVTEVSLPEKGNVQEVELPVMNNTEQTQETPKQIYFSISSNFPMRLAIVILKGDKCTNLFMVSCYLKRNLSWSSCHGSVVSESD